MKMPLVLVSSSTQLAGAEADLGVMAGDVAIRIGQHPVVVLRAADAPAGDAEQLRAALAERLVMVADDSEFQCHR